MYVYIYIYMYILLSNICLAYVAGFSISYVY